jgi:hypothetical protein
MCGRFTLRTPAADLVQIFQLVRAPEQTPRYNIAPTQPVAAVRQIGQDRELSFFQWGLIRSWAKATGPAARTRRATSPADSACPPTLPCAWCCSFPTSLLPKSNGDGVVFQHPTVDSELLRARFDFQARTTMP